MFQHYVSQMIVPRENDPSQRYLRRACGQSARASIFSSRIGSDAEVVRGSAEQAGVIVYDSFQRHFGVKLGDSIELDTPQGRRQLPGRRCSTGVSDWFGRWHPDGPGHVRPVLDPPRRIESDRLDQRSRTATCSMRSREESEQSNRSSLVARRADGSTRRDTLGRHAGLIYGATRARRGPCWGRGRQPSCRRLKDIRGDMALLQCLGASRSQLLRLLLIEGLSSRIGGCRSQASHSRSFLPLPLGALLTEEFGGSSRGVSGRGVSAPLRGTRGYLRHRRAWRLTRIQREISWNADGP